MNSTLRMASLVATALLFQLGMGSLASAQQSIHIQFSGGTVQDYVDAIKAAAATREMDVNVFVSADAAGRNRSRN